MDQSPQPVITSQVIPVVTALLTALAAFGAAFGLFTLTKEQIEATLGLVGAMLLLIPFLTVVAAWWAHNRVTPTAAPKLAQGTTVEVVTPGDAPNTTTTV